uniref:SCP domain-containing protein n=1 Tax=Scleropages formosus TaxID=113540 RepID=A0A8C9TJJ7_SCLFO
SIVNVTFKNNGGQCCQEPYRLYKKSAKLSSTPRTPRNDQSNFALTEISPENATVQQQIVDLHNAFRRAVEPTASNMLMMSWSEEVAASAQKWVTLIRSLFVLLFIFIDYQCGENLFLSDSIMAWSDVVGAWHSEVKNYQYPSGSKNGGQIGHYTQVTVTAACCRGNFRGVPPYTAGPPCGECPNNCEDKLCSKRQIPCSPVYKPNS